MYTFQFGVLLVAYSSVQSMQFVGKSTAQNVVLSESFCLKENVLRRWKGILGTIIVRRVGVRNLAFDKIMRELGIFFVANGKCETACRNWKFSSRKYEAKSR